METMVMECPPEFCRHIARSYSGGFSSSSGAFSLPRSPSVADGASSPFRRFLITSTEDYSDELVRSLISDLESTCIDSQRQAAMGLRLLAKHSLENCLRIARSSPSSPTRTLSSRSTASLPSSTSPSATRTNSPSYVLRQVLSEPEGRLPAVDEGGVPVLVEMLEVGSRRRRRW